ncbi:MAG: reverse transcriptase family protein [Thiobacillus sp.]|nr:reverse transcriptase family protein [Thiobacillus sp.]
MKITKAKEPQRYEIERSPLYKLSSKRKLSELLEVELTTLSSLEKSGLTSQYRIFKDRKTRRVITEPIEQLAVIHKQLLKLFSRIAPPSYVHSAIKKRSYKTNAEQHKDPANVLKIDVKKFFPSIKFSHIHDFFLNGLCCSKDIAVILSKLCTVQTVKHGVHLPTGSCISPILSFLANRRMFDAVKKICDREGCVFTVYVDDITVSGVNATRALLSEITTVIHKHGYQYHKIKTYHGQPALVTGLVVADGRLRLPHERAKKIRELSKALKALRASKSTPLRSKMLASLVGRLSEAEHINKAYKPLRQKILSSYSAEWSGVIAYRLRKSRTKRLMRNCVITAS